MDDPAQNNGYTNGQALEAFSMDKSSGPGQYLPKSILIDHFGREGSKGNGECGAEEEEGAEAEGSSEVLAV